MASVERTIQSIPFCIWCGAENLGTDQVCAKCGRLLMGPIASLAGIGRRLVALLVDNLLLSLFGLLIGVAMVLFVAIVRVALGLPVEEGRGAALQGAQCLALLFQMAYYTLFWGLFGWSPGKRVVGLRVVRTDGSRVGVRRALLRAVAYFISGLLGGLGFLWAIFDQNSQAWHDKIADTYVIGPLNMEGRHGAPSKRGARALADWFE